MNYKLDRIYFEQRKQEKIHEIQNLDGQLGEKDR